MFNAPSPLRIPLQHTIFSPNPSQNGISPLTSLHFFPNPVVSGLVSPQRVMKEEDSFQFEDSEHQSYICSELDIGEVKSLKEEKDRATPRSRAQGNKPLLLLRSCKPSLAKSQQPKECYGASTCTPRHTESKQHPTSATSTNPLVGSPNLLTSQKATSQTLNLTPATKPVVEKSSKPRIGENAPVRKDVIRKTLVRSMKRFYSGLFNKMYPEFRTLTQRRKAKMIKQLSTTFVTSQFGNVLSFDLADEASKSDLVALIMMFISPSIFKKSQDYPLHKDLFDTLKSGLYRPALVTLAKLNQIPVYYKLLHYFLSTGDFEKFLLEDPTLNRNSEIYRSEMDALKNL